MGWEFGKCIFVVVEYVYCIKMFVDFLDVVEWVVDLLLEEMFFKWCNIFVEEVKKCFFYVIVGCVWEDFEVDEGLVV